MARTPDRRPGVLQEDIEIQFFDNPIGPTVEGAFNYNGDEFVFRDSTGSYNPRGGGVFTVSGTYISTLYTASFFSGLSGSLTNLSDGTSYLIAGTNVQIVSQSNGSITIGTTAINSTEHASLRQLIHLAEEGGPFEEFTLGSYREVLPTGDPFPTSVIWWETSAKLKKIVEETVTYNSQKLITSDEWKVYNTDGVTVLKTATDTITYSGVFETNRTRTIT
jgi:hypothetical protein